jgi:hypothetical protein
MKVVTSKGIRWTGQLLSNQPVNNLYYEALNLSFPVYPAGPVVLSLPFAFMSQADSPSVELSITYMACSDKTCLPPVMDKRQTLKIPLENFQ